MKYRSKLESRVAKVLSHCEYETVKLPFTVDKTHICDFIDVENKIEYQVKGFFRNSAEAKEYLFLREQYPDWTFRFIFQDPQKPMPGAKRRKKCGTKRSMAEWAEKNEFEYARYDSIPDEWKR